MVCWVQVSRLLGDVQCVSGAAVQIASGDRSRHQGGLPGGRLLPLPLLRLPHNDPACALLFRISSSCKGPHASTPDERGF